MFNFKCFIKNIHSVQKKAVKETRRTKKTNT